MKLIASLCKVIAKFGVMCGMRECPMCGRAVRHFKTNSHVLPRAWAKRTKRDGQNIQLDFVNHSIAINQEDYAGDYWCARCESDSSRDDAYGASVLLHGTAGKMTEVQGKKIAWKEISELDYFRFRKFVLSIAIRDHLARKSKSESVILSVEEFENLKRNYRGSQDTAAVFGQFIDGSDPLSQVVHRPVRSRSGNGINFQLFNFALFIFLVPPEAQLESVILRPNGKMRLPIGTSNQAGNLKDIPAAYQKIVDEPKNQKNLDKIRKKYDP